MVLLYLRTSVSPCIFLDLSGTIKGGLIIIIIQNRK